MSKLQTINATAFVGGKTTDLKNKFAAGSIPLDTDFSELIDIAECGRRAVGQSADQSDNSVGAGLALATDGASVGKLSVLPKANAGITVDTSGVGIKAGSGVTVDANGVSVNPSVIFPKGMIMMFSGAEIPPGWALCDGRNGTPDLVGRFILASTISDTGKSNTTTFTGDVTDYAVSTTTTSDKTGLRVSVDSHTLQKENLPFLQLDVHSVNDSSDRYWLRMTEDTAGGTNEHYPITRGRDASYTPPSDRAVATTPHGQKTGVAVAHDTTINDLGHIHNIAVKVPYYTLAYIMKT